MLERELRCALIKGKGGRQVVIGLKRYTENAAYIDIKDPWDKGHHALKINHYWVGLVPAVLHEMAHLHLRRKLASWGLFEEPIVLEVLERELVRYISASPKRSAWWEAAIDLKLPEEDQ
jgi:hypothetical protein